MYFDVAYMMAMRGVIDETGVCGADGCILSDDTYIRWLYMQ